MTGSIRIMRVTERDREITGYIARQGMVEAPQIQRKFFGTKQAAYRRLKVLVEHGLLVHDRVLYGRNGVYRATRAGLIFCGSELYPAGLSFQHLEHSLEVVELSEELLEENPGARWISERELRSRATRARLSEESERIQPDPEGGRMSDGMLVLEDGDLVAVELELTGKPSKTYEKIFTYYAKRRDLAEVRFYVAAESLRQRASRIADQYGLLGYISFHGYSPRITRAGSPPQIATAGGRNGDRQEEKWRLPGEEEEEAALTELENGR